MSAAMTRSFLASATLLFAAAPLLAQNAPPTAGDVLRQSAPPAVPPSAVPLPNIGNVPPPPMSALSSGGQAVAVRSVTVEGNRVIDTGTLEALVRDIAGKTLTLAQMDEAATRLTRHYRAQGYFVARAYVPAQDLTDGHLKLRVIEGNYGEFVLENRSIVRNDVVQGLLDDIKDRDIVSLDTLERAMLIINDTPGVKVVKADVMPGRRIGTSDFAIGTEATPAYDGFLLADNHGSRYTGRDRLTFGANWNSPTGRGDRLGISGLGSTNGDLLNARLAYSSLVHTDGTRLEGAVGRTTYSLGDAYSALDARGTADNVELNLTHPYKRTRNASLSIGAGYVHRDLRDEIRSTDTSTRKSSDAIALRLDSSLTHRLFDQDGITTFNGAITFGHLDFHDAVAAAQDASGARTAGNWSKLNLALTRVSLLPYGLQLSATARAQTVLTPRNLDGSEKLTVSGVGGVAAYPTGELAGDHAFVTRAELVAPLGQVGNAQLQGNVFASWGVARAAQPVLVTQHTRQLADAGIGFNINVASSQLRLMLANRIHGGAPTSEPAPRTRVLLQAGIFF